MGGDETAVGRSIEAKGLERYTDGPLTEDTPLTPTEQKFIMYYMETSIASEALRKAGVTCVNDEEYKRLAYVWLRRPNIRAEIDRVMEELKKETVATAEEVMTYFTSVMRGEVKDQFGLEAPLSERTAAAKELARRTIDLENKRAGYGDANINVTLNWEGIVGGESE